MRFALLRRTILAAACAAALAAPVAADQERLRADVTYLASDELQGRMTATEGERLAAAHIIAELEKMGAVPLPGLDGFRHRFDYSSGVSPAATGNEFRLFFKPTPDGMGEQVLDLGTGWAPFAFSENGTVEGELVFAGYGIRLPESEGVPYDSWASVDVKDKIAVVLRYWPENADDELRARLSRYGTTRFKALAAREAGAKAMVIVTGPNSPPVDNISSIAGDASGGDAGILCITVSSMAAGLIFRESGKELAPIQNDLDSGNPHVSGFPLGVKARLSVNMEREVSDAFNVIGVLPATAKDPATEYVMIGAHYDHLGLGRAGGSMATGREADAIHHGADDNASGVAATLEAGRTLAAMSRERKRPVVLAFWSGEEMGLIGSRAFADQMPLPEGGKLVAYLNLDMVGRLRNNQLAVQGTGSSDDWVPLLEKLNVGAAFSLSLQADPYQPSDIQSLYMAGVPSLMLFTNLHDDYHRPSDTAEKINYSGLERIARFSAGWALDMATRPAPPVLKAYDKPRMEQMGQRDGLRAYLGTIPDYVADVKGVKITGTKAGSPAEKAGLRPNDVIVRLGKTTIENIYDYTYAIDAVKIGVETDLVVMRDGKELTLKVTPTAR